MNGNRKKEPSVLDAIRDTCADGPVSYRDFIDCALYHPEAGYYRRDTERVGRSSKGDFYTAESLGPVFSRLVVAAASKLLGPEASRQASFIEIGSEPGSDLLSVADAHPFPETRTLRYGDPLELNGQCIVFANEWLDALPFHRVRFTGDRWRERGVRYCPDGSLEEVLLDVPGPAVANALDRLPENAPEGYEMDLPLDAEKALGRIAAQDWSGLLLLFDYGKSLKELATTTPRGTARAFHRHKRESNLLLRPGEQDITCDLCWDWLEKNLKEKGFHTPNLESQEAFFVHHAASEAEKIVADSAGNFSRDRQTLMELIHPSHMGARFQVLHALR